MGLPPELPPLARQVLNRHPPVQAGNRILFGIPNFRVSSELGTPKVSSRQVDEVLRNRNSIR